MDFDELHRSIVLTEESILSQVDEYTLYCFYTGIDNLMLNTAYNCPYRDDRRPSFSVYESKYFPRAEYAWKDSATGESGDIFKLIGLIEGITRLQALSKINQDFELGYDTQRVEPKEKIMRFIRPRSFPIKIRIAPVPFTAAGTVFWQQYTIGLDLLSMYNVEQIQWYWSFVEQQAPTWVPDPAFSYRIGEYYQIYNPFADKENKFRNDLPETYFFGYQQLSQTSDVLIIDKSCKDVIFCRKLGYEAVAPKSESTMIPDRKMLELKERFRDIYLMLDPDPCGMMMTTKYMETYPWLKPRFLPESKDKTDLCKSVGFDRTKEIVTSLLT